MITHTSEVASFILVQDYVVYTATIWMLVKLVKN